MFKKKASLPNLFVMSHDQIDTFVTEDVILLSEFKIPQQEEEPTMSASTCLKAEKTSMIFLFMGLIFPEAPVCRVYF